MKFLYRIALIIICVQSAAAQFGTLESTFHLASVSGSTVPYQNGIPVPSFEKQPRVMQSLAGAWKKLRFNADHNVSLLKRDSNGYAQLLAEAGGRHMPHFDDSQWQTKPIPGVENTLNANEKTPEFYQNGVWYRTTFSASDSLQQRFARLNFYSVNYTADVWLNGTYLGWHEGGFTPFSFDVSRVLRYDSLNVLSVRVDNIPWGTRKDIVPYYECDWFNYTGIIHDVYLEFSEKQSVIRADVITKNINGLIEATVVAQNRTALSSNLDIAVEVFKALNDSMSLTKEISAELAGEAASVQGKIHDSIFVPADSIAVWKSSLTVQDPNLWSPIHPHLYILKITLSQNGKIKDQYFTQFGIRTIKTVGDKIHLNEKPVLLHGVARHEDHPEYGRSIPADVIASDLRIIKNVKANYLRTGHYPNHPFTYVAADRIGLLTMEEIPVWWFDETLPWLLQNNVRFIHRQMFREMAYRDRNRASIVLWSLSNECADVPGRISFYQSMRSEIETFYPDGRLLTQSAAADRPGPNDESQGYVDAAGWTMYFGIFYNPSGFGRYRGTKYFTVDAHDYFPRKPIIATEFGYWSKEDMTQFTLQVLTFDSTFLAFEPRLPVAKDGTYNAAGFIAGITWWCMFDWYTHQQTGGFQSMGLMRMNRSVQKPVYSSLRSAYNKLSEKSEYITTVTQNRVKELPTSYSLFQNYPNPFNPTSVIGFQLPSDTHVRLSVYDILGKHVALLVDEKKSAGEYTVPFSATSLSAGVYFYRLNAGSYTATKKMTVLK